LIFLTNVGSPGGEVMDGECDSAKDAEEGENKYYCT
jgi:hypothetical protein